MSEGRVSAGGVRVDSDIPIPRRNRGLPSKNPVTLTLRDIQVGESFFLPARTREEARIINGRAAAERYGIRITQRRVTENGVDGVRIWRVK